MSLIRQMKIEGNSGTTAEVTQNNELKTLPSDFGLELTQGNITGLSYVHKFGQAPDFDTGDNEVYIWDGADDGGINEMTYTFSTSAAIDSISSSSTADNEVIDVQGS